MYIYTLFILVIIINVRCVALFATLLSLSLPFSLSLCLRRLGSGPILRSHSITLVFFSFLSCLSHSLPLRISLSLFVLLWFSLKFRSGSFLSFLLPLLMFRFRSISTQFNYFKVTKKKHQQSVICSCRSETVHSIQHNITQHIRCKFFGVRAKTLLALFYSVSTIVGTIPFAFLFDGKKFRLLILSLLEKLFFFCIFHKKKKKKRENCNYLPKFLRSLTV